MDSTVDGFVDGVVTGARVMKSMIGDFMPNKQSSPNVMDYLPTETTRIKYIIRNPHTKETKIIRIRPSKKVVKIMTITPKPLMADKQKSMHMLNPEKLRKLEKEQELIAEGRMPMKQEKKPSYMELKSEKDAHEQSVKSQSENDIVSGTIQEFGDSWKPVYMFADTPVGFSTAKPIMMSPLHTSVVGELLPEPQKQVYDPLNDLNELPEEETKKSNTYEVTEYTAEESVVQPLTHDYYNLRNQPSRESLHKPSSVVTEDPLLVTQIEDELAVKSYLSEYRSQRGFVPSRHNYRSNTETTTISTSTSTTTTEEPNYPIAFLKKYRERPDNNYHSKSQQRSKIAELSVESSWIPSNATYSSPKSRQHQYHQYSPSNVAQRTKSQKWPPDVEESHQHTASSYDIPNTTDAPPTHQEFTTQSIRNNGHSRKNVRLKTPHLINSEYKQTNVKQRGSVKYGDRIEIE